MRTEIPIERAIAIGGETEAPVMFQGIEVTVTDSPAKEVWIQNPPRRGRGRTTTYVQGLEFIVRKLGGMLEDALRNEHRLTTELRRAKSDGAEAARTAQRENARLKKENEAQQKRILDLEIQEAEHGRQMAAKKQELSERASQVQDAQAQTRLREEQHQELFDNVNKAHAEQLASLREEQERETDQLNESHRQIVEGMEKDVKAVRGELQELQGANAELRERNKALDSAKQIFEEAAEQSDALLKVITAVTGFVSPVRYVLFVDDKGKVVEDQTYVRGEGDDADNVPSDIFIHGEDIGITYQQSSPARMIAYSRSNDGNIAEQEVPLDERGVPTLAGLVLLQFLKRAEVCPENTTVRNFRDHPMFQRLIFGDPTNEDADEASEEDSEDKE